MNDDDLIASYVLRSAPVQWVAWNMKLRGDPHESELHTILFDAENQLRDLSASEVRAQVIEEAKKCPALRGLILSEIEDVVDKVLAKIDQDNSSETV